MLGVWRAKRLASRAQDVLRLRSARRAVARFPAVADRRPHGLPAPLMVNLTSYPPRFASLEPTIRSLLDQSIVPDRTILWLAHGDIVALPAGVSALQAHGLEIRGCDDTRSYKKLIPALAEWPDAFHVTADDDVYYPPNWLAGLVGAVDLATPVVTAWRVHLAGRDAGGSVQPYGRWELATSALRGDPGVTALFPTGVGGVLYPPGSLHPDVLDEARFRALCPAGDDIWFFWMARRNGVSHARVPQRFDLVEWPDTQGVGLRIVNLDGDGNDRQIQAMEEAYGPFPF